MSVFSSISKPALTGELRLNSEAANQWIEQFPSEDRSAFQELITKIRGIEFKVFCAALETSVSATRKNIKGTPTILTAMHKSNEWVAQLAAQFFDFKGDSMELGHDDASEFVQSLQAMSPSKWPAEIVLFDDASYSGNQMSRHVQAIVDAMKDKVTKKTKISVIVPFMTEMAMKKLQDIALPKNIEFAIAPRERIYTVKESMSDANYQVLSKHFSDLLPSGDDSGVTATYMSHKIPNSQSFLTPLQHANILPSIKPPYVRKSH